MKQAKRGWYPNTNQPGTFLFWDGRQWLGKPYTQEELNLVLADSKLKKQAESAPPMGKKSQSEVIENSTFPKLNIFNAKKIAASLENQLQGLQLELDTCEKNKSDLERLIKEYGLASDLERLELRKELELEITALQTSFDDLQTNTKLLETDKTRIEEEIIDLRSVASLQQFGLYDFDHPAESSVELSAELEDVRSQIKQMVKDKTATKSATGFTFNNSAKEGEKFVKDMSTLLLRAYNAEAENCVKGAKAGNYEANIKRLSTAITQIEKSGAMISLEISRKFHKLRLKEIELATKYLVVLAEEKRADQEHRAQLREEARVKRELEREMKKLSDNKEMLESALLAAQANGDEAAIQKTLEKLEQVQKNLEDVNALAANRRMGHVYIISNIGAFGDDVVKIGMTRRMDPLDRVRELGDASVPFRFDVHAIIFSEDAVGLETSLHRKFESKRVNKINSHREFFRVTPQEVLEELKEESVVLKSFVLEPQAEEFRASIGEIEIDLKSVDSSIPNEDELDSEDLEEE